MEYIQTVCGKVSTDEIKYCDSHTHIIAYANEALIQKDPDLLLDREDVLQQDLAVFKENQGNLIAEMTTVDYGRDVQALKNIAIKNNVHIIACCGFNKGIYNRPFLENKTSDEVCEDLIRELREGVDQTGILPGILKIGTSLNKIEPWEAIGLHAIAKAHRKTGIPISTHTQNGTMALEQLVVFEEEKIPYEHIILCHLDHNDDFALHEYLVKKGVYLSYDSIAKEKYHTNQRAIDFIVKLAKQGLHTQILVGSDFARRSCYIGYGGNPGFAGVFVQFKQDLYQRLLEEGLAADEIIDQIYHRNPQKAFRIRKVSL